MGARLRRFVEAWSGYIVAATAVVLAVSLRVVLQPYVGVGAATTTLYGAVAIAVWYGGFLPGLFAAVVGYLAANYFFIEPIGAFGLYTPRDWARFGAYLFSSTLIISLGGAMHAARRRAEAAVTALDGKEQELRQRVAQLETVEERFRAFMHNSPDFVFIKDEEGRYVFLNRAAERLLGVSEEQWRGRTDEELLPAEVARTIREHDRAVLASDAPANYDLTLERSGVARLINSTKFPLRDSSGRRFIGSITTDVTEARRSEQALREADRHKDEFLATLAHELRNPLAPIRNAVAILGRKSAADPELAWGRDVIERQVQQMTRLIEDLLDIERISRGKLLVRKERITLDRAVDLALETARPQINAAGHRFAVVLPSEPVTLDADPTRLAQVFANLLINAAKYTEPRGTIDLSATVEGSTLVVSVEDSGIGFSAEAASHFFKPFSQAAKGLGIGLSLVHGIVSLHGGAVEAHSGGAGLGSRFVVRLPLASPAPREMERATRSTAPEMPAPGTRVLVADDNKDAADSLQRILTLYGYDVKVAYDGGGALELADDFWPRIAVLDIGMPGANGYEVARAFRQRQGDRVVLVALTGWGQEADRRRSREAGFDYHLTKPVDPGVLNDLLLEVAGARRRSSS